MCVLAMTNILDIRPMILPYCIILEIETMTKSSVDTECALQVDPLQMECACALTHSMRWYVNSETTTTTTKKWRGKIAKSSVRDMILVSTVN